MKALLTTLATILFTLTPANAEDSASLVEARAKVQTMTLQQQAEAVALLTRDHRSGELENLGRERYVSATANALAAPCPGVGYLSSRFAGKPDPWPCGQTLPNEEMLARYIARYGQAPGSGGARIGYCCELAGLNYEALGNAAAAGGTGPDGEHLHPGTVSDTEATDLSFVASRCGVYVGTWVVRPREADIAAHPIPASRSDHACSPPPFTEPGTMFSCYPVTYTYNNVPPCGSAPPAPRCGDGHVDPGETCVNCPADIGPCEPPPTVCTAPCILPAACPACPTPPPCATCPTLLPITQAQRDACVKQRAAHPPGTGLYRTMVKPLCPDLVERAESWRAKP